MPTRRSEPARRSGAPTLHDVASDAGVSAMTVSRVLNGGSNVRPELRRKVERSVARLGYRRNENARSIRPGQRTGLVGVIITNITNPYYAQVLLGIEDTLDRDRRRILVGISHGSAEREARLVSDFVGRQVEGLVVVPTGARVAHLEPSQLRGIPLVLASRAQEAVAADTVVIDDLAATRAAVVEQLRLGPSRVAFLGNAADVSTAQRRFEGYRQALHAHGDDVEEVLVARDCHDPDSAAAAMARLLELDEPPTAVFCANNQVTVGALQVLIPWRRAHSGRPPVALLAMDEFPLCDLIDYPMTLITHDARALGRTAAGLLVQRFADPSTPPLRVELSTGVRRVP